MEDQYPAGAYPLAYLITIRSYGTWLHGDEKGSVDRHGFNHFGTPRMFQSQNLKDYMKQQMKQPAVYLDEAQRVCVLGAVKEVCNFRGYELSAINIRTNHLHAVVSAQAKPEKIINEFKTFATRKLRLSNLIAKDKAIWARSGSRRYLWKSCHIETAIEYVSFGQGEEIPNFD